MFLPLDTAVKNTGKGSGHTASMLFGAEGEVFIRKTLKICYKQYLSTSE
jgi:hypothetical protein